MIVYTLGPRILYKSTASTKSLPQVVAADNTCGLVDDLKDGTAAVKVKRGKVVGIPDRVEMTAKGLMLGA